MEKIIEILWTKKSEKDLNSIYNFLICEIPEEKSYEIIKNIVEKVDLLFIFPKAGSVELQLTKLKREYRKLIEGNYKIIYSIRNNKIYIHTVFDARQNPNKMKTK